MTFKKYTITYEIKAQEEIIEILDIFNRNKPQIQQVVANKNIWLQRQISKKKT